MEFARAAASEYYMTWLGWGQKRIFSEVKPNEQHVLVLAYVLFLPRFGYLIYKDQTAIQEGSMANQQEEKDDPHIGTSHGRRRENARINVFITRYLN